MMRKFKTYLNTFVLLLTAFVLMRCSNNDEIQVKPDTQYDAVLNVNEAGPQNQNVEVIVDANTQSTIEAKVTFKSTTGMYRLYITQNIKGQGETIFKPTEKVDLKGDGAVDLAKQNKNDFEFQFALPIPSGVGTDGTVVYKFWVTSGNGDFRDPTKKTIGTPGAITIKFGKATNPTADVKLFENKKLFTPTADAKSMTFISLLDGKIYTIAQGEEYISFWDFGYINLMDGGPALHSTFSYPASAIPSLAALIDKNTTYFRKSDKTSAQFDAISVSSDLDFITTPSDTYVKALATGDIVEFVDRYGKKGMIKVVQATPGNESDKFIIITIKVQP